MNRKAKLAKPLVIALMAWILAITSGCLSPVSAQTAGIGISDWEVNTTIQVGQSQIFDIARVKNEGAIGLTVTAEWVPNFDNSDAGIELRFYPTTIHLDSREDMLVKGEVVKALKTGTYSGLVEFTTKVDAPEGMSGSVSTPSGTAHATFNIIVASTSEETTLLPPGSSICWFH